MKNPCFLMFSEHKFIDLMSQDSGLSDGSPLLLLVSDQFQVVDPFIPGFEKLSFERNVPYNATVCITQFLFSI